MPQLLLELFSEEIPARMQAQAADDLKRLMIGALNQRGLAAIGAQPFVTPRRLTLVIADLPAASAGASEELKGPRTSAPDAALAGFLKKTGLTKDQLTVQSDPKGDVYIARIEKAGRPAPELIAEAIVETVRAFPWPKSMTWEPSGLRWVRPLRSILCLFDGAVVPFQLAGLTAGDTTRGHRQMANEPFAVKDFRDYDLKLRERRVVLDRSDRKRIIDEQAQLAAANAGLVFREDEALLDEVAGLVEYPMVLTGHFEEAFLTVPQEVLISTMRTNQKYFALYQRDSAPTPAPHPEKATPLRHPEEGAPAPVSKDAPTVDDLRPTADLGPPARHPEEGAPAPVSKDAPHADDLSPTADLGPPARHPEEGAPAPVSKDAPHADDLSPTADLGPPARHPEEGAPAPISKDARTLRHHASFETRPPAAPQDDGLGGIPDTSHAEVQAKQASNHAPRLANAFLIVSNLEARDGGRAIVAGNEKVIRARLADAKFFWEQDLKETLEDRLPKLKDIVFHAKLGTQWDRVQRIERLAGEIAARIGADVEQAKLAARLCKSDLVSGTVGEFPEVQGTIGGYLARAEGLPEAVADAIADHYRPQGPSDRVPTALVSVAVALADKLDTIAAFLEINERPTGSKDPFAIRRAALGYCALTLTNGVRIPADILRLACDEVVQQRFDREKEEISLVAKHADENLVLGGAVAEAAEGSPRLLDIGFGEAYGGRRTALYVWQFLLERLKVLLRDQGKKHDLIDAVATLNSQDDLVLLVRSVEALQSFLATDDGKNLLAGYKRAANILRIEEKRDKTNYAGDVDPTKLRLAEERALFAAIEDAEPRIAAAIAREDFATAMTALANLRAPTDAFFDKVKVNDDNPAIRINRLNLLARLKTAAHLVADFSKIEG